MNDSLKAFLTLLQAGLWNRELLLSHFEDKVFSEIYRIAEEQSVIGLVASGMEILNASANLTVPLEMKLQIIGEALQIEQQNKEMNAFIAELNSYLRERNVSTLLVKGQGIAQCYERPLMRACGDIDLFLSNENYYFAKTILPAIASEVDEEDTISKHLAMTIGNWKVELHGTLRTQLGNIIDAIVDDVQCDTFKNKKFRVWRNGKEEVLLPDANNDVIFVFTHILQHFFKEGIGLRQVCDLLRLLWTYKDTIDENLLHKRLKEMKMLTEWQVFTMLGIIYLGAPQDAVPLSKNNWYVRRKAKRLLSFIIESGNFGKNRDSTYYHKHTFLVYKTISLYYHIVDFTKHARIFPIDSVKMLSQNIINGIKSAIKEIIASHLGLNNS